jgi:hypothetical protein
MGAQEAIQGAFFYFDGSLGFRTSLLEIRVLQGVFTNTYNKPLP